MHVYQLYAWLLIISHFQRIAAYTSRTFCYICSEKPPPSLLQKHLQQHKWHLLKCQSLHTCISGKRQSTPEYRKDNLGPYFPDDLNTEAHARERACINGWKVFRWWWGMAFTYKYATA